MPSWIGGFQVAKLLNTSFYSGSLAHFSYHVQYTIFFYFSQLVSLINSIICLIILGSSYIFQLAFSLNLFLLLISFFALFTNDI